MKTNITAFFTVALVASSSIAQNTSTTRISTDDISSKGVRIGLVKPMLEAEIKASYKGQSASAKQKLDDTTGFSLGYVSLPVQELGWTSNLTYMDIKNDGSSTGLVRIDGNLAYAFTSILNAKGGINLSKITSNEGNSDELNPAIGFQAGLGVQISKDFGVDFGYSQMNQSGTLSGISVDFKEAGFEIGVNGTF